MQLEFERGCHAEIAATTPKRPEQVSVLIFAGSDDLAIGGHEFDRNEVVESQPILAHQPAESAAQRKAGNSCRRDYPSRHRQFVQLRFAVQFAPGRPALCLHTAPARVNMDSLHQRQVNHQAVIDCRPPRNVMSATAHGHFQTEITSQKNSIHDIGYALAAGNQCGALVNQTVVHPPCFVVIRCSRLDQLTAEARQGSAGGEKWLPRCPYKRRAQPPAPGFPVG